MGACGRSHTIENENELENKTNFNKYKIIEINTVDYENVKKKIGELTGFKFYEPQKLEINKTQNYITGTYFQSTKGCILYALINNGWVDENFIPDSMKYYKDHHHHEEENNEINLLKRSMSVIDLAQLWYNLGGNCVYSEIDLNEVRKRIFLVLKEYFEKPSLDIMVEVDYMTLQNIDYFQLIGNINVKYIPLRELLNENPCMKKGIEEGIIKNRSMVKFGRHFLIFDKIVQEGKDKIYYFQDSLSFLYGESPTEYHNNCEFDKIKGYIFAHEDSGIINVKDSDKMNIGILKVINN